MEVDNYLNETKMLLEGPMFNFHDYGMKGKYTQIHWT